MRYCKKKKIRLPFFRSFRKKNKKQKNWEIQKFTIYAKMTSANMTS